MSTAFERRLNDAIHGAIGSHGMRDSDVKTATLATLTDLYLEHVHFGASDLPDHFAELMCGLLPRVSEAARGEVARRLAHTDAVPESILKLLIADEPSVAGLALRQSPLLGKEVLLAAARGRSADKAHAVAGRAGLPREVVAALIDRADPVVASELAVAEGTPLEGREADRLARIPGLSREAASRLADVPGLSDEALLTLFWQLDAEGRGHALKRVARRRDSLRAGPGGQGRHGLGETLLKLAARRRKAEIAEHLATELHLPVALADRIIEDEGGEPLVVAGRAAALPVEHVTGVVLLCAPGAAKSHAALRALAELAERLEPHIAAHMVALWRRPAARSSRQARHAPVIARPPEQAREAAPPGEARRLQRIVAEFGERREE